MGQQQQQQAGRNGMQLPMSAGLPFGGGPPGPMPVTSGSRGGPPGAGGAVPSVGFLCSFTLPLSGVHTTELCPSRALQFHGFVA